MGGKTVGVDKEAAIAAAGDEPEAIAQATRLVEETLKNDPFIDPILPVSMDKPPEGMTTSWSVTRVCDPAEMTVPDKPNEDGAPTSKTISNAVVAVKSMVWLGAVTVCRNEEFVSVYMGYGHKVGTYFPVAPPEVLDSRKTSRTARSRKPDRRWLRMMAAWLSRRLSRGLFAAGLTTL